MATRTRPLRRPAHTMGDEWRPAPPLVAFVLSPFLFPHFFVLVAFALAHTSISGAFLFHPPSLHTCSTPCALALCLNTMRIQ